MAAALVALVACGGGEAGVPGSPETSGSRDLGASGGRARRVVFVVMDTVRADHLGVYGYERPTTPRLASLAETATLYTGAQAVAPWTLPSHASMFTGLYPFEHGAHTRGTPDEVVPAGALADSHTTLAEVLREEGFRTGAFVANRAYLARRWGLNQGFDTYRVERLPAAGITERALEWIDEAQASPFFLFLNYMDAHTPYSCEPRAGFGETGGPARARSVHEELTQLVLAEERDAPADLRAEHVAQYDTAIANLDEALGELVDGLRERELLDDALVVITSDHGEYFGEKHLIGHGVDVYQGALRIPLIVKEPGQSAARVDTGPISHVHLPGLVSGHALAVEDVPAAFRDPWPRGPVLSENYFALPNIVRHPWSERFRRVRTSLVDGDFKYIHSSDGAHALYDLNRDPGETSNLLEAEPELARGSRERLQSMMPEERRARELPPVEAPTAEELEAMKALGYADGDS